MREMLNVLELLAAEAPPAEIEDLLRRARQGVTGADEMRHLERAGLMAADIQALFSRRQRREAELSALVDTVRDLTLPYDLDALLATITRRTRTLLGLDMSYISFRDTEAGDSFVRTADGHASALTVGYRIPCSAGLGDKAIKESLPIWSADYLADDRIAHTAVLDEVVRAEGLRAVIAAPLRFGDHTFGVLYAADRDVRHFTAGEVSLMSSLGDMAAVAIEKTRALEKSHADLVSLRSGTSRITSQLEVLRELAERHASLVDRALGGGGLSALAGGIAEVFDGAVRVRDMEYRPLAGSGTIPAVGEAEVWEASRAASARRVPVVLPTGTWVVPVTAGGEELAVLLVHPREPVDGRSGTSLRLAAQSVAVLLQLHRAEAAAASPFRDELFEDLLVAPHRSARQFLQRAGRLGIDLERPHVVVVVRAEGGARARAAGWAAAYARRMDGLRSVQNGSIALLLPSADSSVAAAEVSGELSPLLDHPVTVGAAGPVTGPAPIQQAHQEALRCVDALVSLDSAGGYASTEDLGFLGVLLSDDRDAASFIDATIGPVLDYDAQRSTELTRTLDEYFAAGGSPRHAADALHVHPNTVSRRLERITELLGAEWLRPERALDVQVALRLHRTHGLLLRKRDGAGVQAAGEKPPEAPADRNSAIA
ncbi:helix-turn-helix domain-containing protein [Streptomyces sp. CAU 1734]|uniref:helix-turn-helix domain-containing protein n=1 Tax=Streptomyces sp. CAU 1734 TaxID=3140360 RepID=UPI003260FA1D